MSIILCRLDVGVPRFPASLGRSQVRMMGGVVEERVKQIENPRRYCGFPGLFLYSFKRSFVCQIIRHLCIFFFFSYSYLEQVTVLSTPALFYYYHPAEVNVVCTRSYYIIIIFIS